MATPPVSDEILRSTYEAFLEHNCNQSTTAKALGVSRETIQRRLRRARERGIHLSDGGKESMLRAGLSGAEISGGWRHNYDDSGKKVDSVRWIVPKHEIELETVLERAAVAFRNIPKAPPIPTPRNSVSNLLTLYPLFDVHLGMRADAAETGRVDYDTKLAVEDIHAAMGRVMALSPDSVASVLLVGGDFFHATDNTNQTPKSKHSLDVDTRLFRTVETGIEVIAATIDRLASKHKKVKVRVLRGNHDEVSYLMLTIGLIQRYRNNKRITIDDSRIDIFMHQWGRCLIAAHHGDKQKPDRLAMTIAEICSFWSESPHRIILTGHRHHVRSEEFPGIVWEQLRAFCPPDAYGTLFAPRRAAHAMTFHNTSGMILRAQDPVDRLN